MDPKVDFFEILRNEGKTQTILVYPSTDRISDPYEKTMDQKILNSLPCEAYVIDEGFSSLKYKYFGELPYESKKILCHVEDVNLLKTAAKIQIKDNYYYVYKDADKNFAVLSRENYAVVVLARKPNVI
jgi:hypothetical protein